MGKVLNSIETALGIYLACTGCNSNGCTDNQSSIPLADFYSYTTLEPVTLGPISIGGVDAPDDSLLLRSGTVNRIYLPFRALSNTTKYFIHYEQSGIDDPAYNDTLTFDYERIPYFASEECGAMYRYQITSLVYTKHIVDSVGIIDSLITNIDKVSLKIFFRTYDVPEENPDQPDIPEENPVNPSDTDTSDNGEEVES